MQISQIVRSFVGCIALFAMWMPYLHPIGLHQHDHADHEHHCSAELESDACHRRLKHHDFSVDCEHSGHLSEAEEHCALCEFYVDSTYQLAPRSELNVPIVYAELNYIDYCLGPTTTQVLGFHGRAPPSFG